MRLRLLAAPLLLGAFAATPGDARCEVARCSCALGGIENSLPRMAAVFLGEVTRVIPGAETRVPRAHFNVLRSWKGADSPVASLDLQGNLKGGGCDLSPRVGDTVLLFAIRLPNGQLYAGLCGSIRGSGAAAVMERLGAYRVPRRNAQTRPRPAVDSTLVHRLGREAHDLARALPQLNPSEDSPARQVSELLATLQLRAGAVSDAYQSAKGLGASYFTFAKVANRQREIGDTAGLLATIDASPQREDLAYSIISEYRNRDSTARAVALERRFPTPSYSAGVGTRAARDASDSAYRLAASSLSVYGPDSARADSLARLAYAVANAIRDSALRARTRQSVNLNVSAIMGNRVVPRMTLLLEQAETLDERIFALQKLAAAEVARDTDLTAALATVAKLEAIAPARAVANTLLSLRIDDVYFSTDTAFQRRAHTTRLPLFQRAIALGESVDTAFGDTVRTHIVGAMLERDPWAAADVAMGIRSPRMRERAMVRIVRREIELNVSGPLDTARVAISAPVLDSLYAAIAVRQVVHGPAPAALGTAARITARSVWAVAISEIAHVAHGRADTLVTRAMLREALAQLDPRANYTTIATKTLPAMLAFDDVATVVAWARGKAGAAGVYARLAVMQALLQCGESWWEC